MALSFEESKKLLAQKAAEAAKPMVMMARAPEDAGIMTLAGEDNVAIAAYSTWTKSSKYTWYDEYADSNICTIDDKKNIILNSSQINITQEENSQFIPFEMPRYYDGYDLMNATIWIYYMSSDGISGSSKAVNVSYDEASIKFGWLVDGQATHVAGNLKFEIRAFGSNSMGEAYVWKSKTFEHMNVLQSLIDDRVIELDDSWVQELAHSVAEAVAEQVAKTAVEDFAVRAEDAASRAETAADNAQTTAQETVDEALENYYTQDQVDSKISTVNTKFNNYYTSTEVDTKIDSIDGLAKFNVEYENAKMTFYNGEEVMDEIAINSDPSVEWTSAYDKKVDDKIAAETGKIQGDLDAYKETVNADLESIHENIDDLPNTLQSDYYNKEATDELLAQKADSTVVSGVETRVDTIAADVNTNKANIQSANSAIALINQTLESLDKSPNKTYEAIYNDTSDVNGGENVFVLYEITNEAQENEERIVKSKFTITGGSGGGTSGNVIKIERITASPLVVAVNDKVIIEYNFTGTDATGDDLDQGNATWKLGNRVIKTETVYTGQNSIDLTGIIGVGSDQKITLIISDDIGTTQQKTWYVSVIDVKLESAFDDTRKYIAGSPVNFTFTPYGAVDKTLHFLLDGVEIGTKISSKAAAGLSDSYNIPAQAHGTHLFEIYMTAEINGNVLGLEEIVDKDSGEVVGYNHTINIVKDIIWYDENSDIPVIGCVQQAFTARQYEATNIKYTVYDPSTETPSVTLRATYVNSDGETVEEFRSDLVLNSNTPDPWQYKTSVIGEHILTITCGETVKTIIVNIVELGINIDPITAGLVFDFNPVGHSNNDANRLWSYGDTGIKMTVSDNFDWVNGGYQIDGNGDQCFCIKAGTSAEINYQLFGNDAKTNGKQFKLIFKTENVANSDATFLSCVSDTIGTDKVGIEMKAHEATIYAKTESLPLPYAEEEIIEFEFNITPSSANPSMIMGYEDGVSTRPLVYDATHDFQQQKDYRKIITLGSDDCDLYIYRFKVYDTSLSDRDILKNFIADARSAEEMIDRHMRNQIYKEGILDPDYLAEVCPQLRIIKIETPYFTSDKDEKIGRVVSDTTGETLTTNVECIFKGGDPILDNWVATDVVHSGQGTSSNNYGPAGRNLDIIMKRYKDKKTEQYLNENPIITLGNNTQVSKVSLTRNSVDVNYFNIKVNIASSENANNALLAKRYNQYNPYQRPIVRTADTLEDHYTAEEIAAMTEDQKSKILAGYQAEADALASYVKDTMEFQNCVVFVKESDPNLTSHREFNDNNWHFYAIGNIGDSKKTDDTRLTDQNDPYECILEVMDNTLPNSTMPTGKVDGEGAPVYPIDPSEWGAGNSAYDSLYADKFDEKKATDKDNGLADTYGWRYIYEDGTDDKNSEVRAYVESKWREFYGFVVTATDEEFKAHLGDYCVLNSVMYYYLFTLRYTMTDNHAKNSFWHYGKTGEVDAEGNPIRKWDLCFDYDNDTALGIDNYGRMTYRYGYEEIDYVDGTKDWVWNAPQHVFFLRLRELFDEELSALYNVLPADCWSATSLINQFNDWQMQFPEELWRLDVERKYIRTYTSSYINGKAYPEFLRERANGRKKTQRAQFEKNQAKYMASKFSSTVAAEDDIILRCSVPNTTLAVPANFDMHLTPYSYVYLNVKYNTSPPIKIRAVPNHEYTIEYDGDVADIIEIYSASCLKSVGDLSACYLTNGTFANATKISELVLGNGTNGYNNTNVMTLGLGSNGLLKKLDIQNMSGLTHSLDLSGLKNLEELYAFGSGTSGVIFADGGNIRIAQIPNVGALQMKNLSYLTDDGFEATSYGNLSRLVAENSLLDLLELINNASSLYQVRLTGINWTFADANTGVELLERLYNLSGVTNTGGNTDRSVLAGYVHVPIIKEKTLADYNAAWPDLIIHANTVTPQFPVTFVNDDGTILDVQYVDHQGVAVDPINRTENPIATPTKESTVSTNYTFAGWEPNVFTPVYGPQTYRATYTESIRKYKVSYVSKGIVLDGYPVEAEYGTTVIYNGKIPTYTLEESGLVYYLFDGWDKSGYVNGDKTINAIYDSCNASIGGAYFEGKDISTLRPVELYAMTKMQEAKKIDIAKYVKEKDTISIQLGNDLVYTDVEEKVLIAEKTTFNGNNYVDTGINLLSEDRDFVLAIDCKMSSGNSNNAVLAQCFSGLDTSGFKLMYNNGVRFAWGSSSSTPFSPNNREMLVIRHIKGENGVHVYSSNVKGDSIYYAEFNGAHPMVHNVSLVFGCSKLEDGSYEQHSVGTIYWSKLWYADLGDDACSKIAYWPHEEMAFELCCETDGKLKRNYLSDNSGSRSSMTFIASNVLSQPVRMNNGSTNVGGWAQYTLNGYLNDRVYNAFQDQWKQLMKQVKVKSSVGGNSTEITNSDCYIFVPSISELIPSMTGEPYASEGTAISHLTTNSARVCYTLDEVAVPYWTRSPSIGNYLPWPYVYSINTSGGLQPVTSMDNASDTYARIMISI